MSCYQIAGQSCDIRVANISEWIPTSLTLLSHRNLITAHCPSLVHVVSSVTIMTLPAVQDDWSVKVIYITAITEILCIWLSSQQWVPVATDTRIYVLTCFHIIGVTRLKKMRRGGHVSWVWEKRNAHKILVRKLEGETPFWETQT